MPGEQSLKAYAAAKPSFPTNGVDATFPKTAAVLAALARMGLVSTVDGERPSRCHSLNSFGNETDSASAILAMTSRLGLRFPRSISPT
jgi:hypothetical protein